MIILRVKKTNLHLYPTTLCLACYFKLFDFFSKAGLLFRFNLLSISY